MGCKVNNFTIKVRLEIILEGIGDIYNNNDKVLGDRNGHNQK